MKIEDYTYEEKQRALDEAWEEMNPVGTNAERLERIKQMQWNGNVIWEMGESELVWLIEQAERAQELERKIKLSEGEKGIKTALNNEAIKIIEEKEKKNKRLCEGIEKLMGKAAEYDSDLRDMDASTVFSELYDLLKVSE